MDDLTKGERASLAAGRGGRSPLPEYETITFWCRISGMSRSKTYQLLAGGTLRAKKLGRRTLIDIPAGLRVIDHLPDAQFRAAKHGGGR